MSMGYDGPSRLRMATVTTFGLGHQRPFPGTWGSLPPIAVMALLLALEVDATTTTLVMAAGVVLFTAACVAFGDEAEARFRRKDPSQVVADETAGQCVALLFFPIHHPRVAALLLASFVLFRLFAIIKPPPVRQMQALPGGPGIVIDDLLAGLMALICVQFLAILI
ncbi:MAG: phosphatidylglycerophosphatase [Phycisphaerae bacterium]|nr:phosphatidylglycerophosphatase [Phycisphaerae bacterium]